MPGVHGSGCGCRNEDQSQAGGYWLTAASIDQDSIRSSGTHSVDSAKSLFRNYSERLDDSHLVESIDPEDPEIIITLSFSSPTRLTSISLIGGLPPFDPRVVRLFANGQPGDFGVVQESEPTQTVELASDFCGAVEYPLRVAKFSQLTSLTLHFPAIQSVKLHWVGLKGVASGDKRQAVVAVYEAKPNVKDHSVSDFAKGAWHIS